MNPVSSIIVSVILSSAILHWSCAVEYDDYIKDKKKIIKHLKEENEGPIWSSIRSLTGSKSKESPDANTGATNFDLCEAGVPDDILLKTCVKVALRIKSQGELLEVFFQWIPTDLQCVDKKISGAGNSFRPMFKCRLMYTKILEGSTPVEYRLPTLFLAQNNHKSKVYVSVSKHEDSPYVDVIGEWTNFNLEDLPGRWGKCYGRMQPMHTFTYQAGKNEASSSR